VRGIGFLGEARSAILHHHERIDGSGYPYGLVGRQIPEFARVVAVADAFDAMTSTRSYRRARPVGAALAELERCAGAQFDPGMVRALVRALDRHGWHPAVTAGVYPPAPPVSSRTETNPTNKTGSPTSTAGCPTGADGSLTGMDRGPVGPGGPSAGVGRESMGVDAASAGVDRDRMGPGGPSAGVGRESAGADGASAGMDRGPMGTEGQPSGVGWESMRGDPPVGGVGGRGRS
jgi:hypothetical protein